MPIARFQMPDGRIARFEVPDGTTPEQAQSMIAQHVQAGGVPEAASQAPASAPVSAPAPSQDSGRTERIAAQQAADRKQHDPTAGMSGGKEFMAGIGKVMVDTWRGAGQLVGRIGDAVTTPRKSTADLITGAPGQTWSQRMGLPQNSDIEQARALDAPLMDTGAGLAGNVAGNILSVLTPGAALKGLATAGSAINAARAGNTLRQALSAAPNAANVLERAGQAIIAPTSLKGAAALGAATGVAQPTVSDEERAMNAGIGGLAGAGGQAAFNTLARVVRPNTSQDVKALLAEGITPTPGQILGGGFKRLEEGLTSRLIIGDAIRGGQQRAVEDLNRAAFDRALAPIGQKLPPGMRGREAVEHVEQSLGDAYNKLLPGLTTTADGQFIQDIQALRNNVQAGDISQEMADRFEKILNNRVLAKFSGSNVSMTGQTLKNVESDLGHFQNQYKRSQDPDQRMLADHVQEVRDILRNLVQRSNPQADDELRAIDKGYANFKRTQRAADSLGAEKGAFTPAQLQNAVKASDRSKDHAAFARGSALMQDLSEPAKAVLGPKLPDSGTPFRLFTGAGAAGLLGALEPTALAGVLATGGLYSKAGQNALANILARRPEAAQGIANRLRLAAPYAVAPSAPLAIDLAGQ